MNAPLATGSSSPLAKATAPLVEVSNLSIQFPSATGGLIQAVRGVSFSLRPGEVLGIVGESGSGKSVSARSLVGLSGPTARITADRLTWRGRDLLAFGARDWRRLRGAEIGLVLQDALVSLDPLRRIGAEIGEAIAAHRRTGRAERQRIARDLLTRVGVSEPELRLRQYSHELSGGLRQRALIATAIAAHPQLIIADEATTALDVNVQHQVLDLLRERVAEGAAVLFISHDIGVVERIADRVLVMRQGEVVEEGPTARVLAAPRHPYTLRLLRAIPSGASKGFRLAVEEGSEAAPAVPLPPHRPGSTVVLAASGLQKAYPTPGGGLRRANRDVGFEIRAGETLGLVGESGSGKSTVARLVMALSRPDQGEITLGGQPWSRLTEVERRPRRHEIQLITQDTLGVFDPRYSVAESLAEALQARAPALRPGAGAPLQAEIRRLCDAVGLPQRHLDKRLRQMSGGERQRVAIARAMATKPRVLICDEPVAALDVSLQAQILDLLQDMQAEEGLASLFISHDLGVVHHMSDRVLVMKDGAIVESGAAEEIFHRPRHPYVASLVAAIPHFSGGRPAAAE